MFERISTSNLLTFLNQHSNLVIAGATVVLAIVTTVYACITYRLQNLIKRQVVSDIRLVDIRLRSFIELVQEKSFTLSCNITNKNTASGSITKPILRVKFPDSSEERIAPDKTITSTLDPDSILPVIYLSGGEMRPATFNYYIDTNSQILKTDIQKLLCSIEYGDNLGRKFDLQVNLSSGEWLD